jgi:general nucleoside transport system permease protein
MRIERRLEPPGWLALAVPAVSVALAFVAGSIVLLITGHDPVETLSRLIDRGFISEGGVSAALVTGTPLLFTGLAAAVAFRMRLWNIGAEGQLYMGAVGASGVGLALADRPGFVLVLAMVAGGLVAGAAWGAIPGILRAYLNTNEIISSLMLNYVAGLLLSYLIFDSHSFWRDLSPEASSFPQAKRMSPDAAWPSLLAGLNPALIALVILLVGGAWWMWRLRKNDAGTWTWWHPVLVLLVPFAAVIAWVVAHPNLVIRVPMGFSLGIVVAATLAVSYPLTRFGFEVRTVGDSLSAARYAGMRTRRKIVAVMALSGAIAGLGGASQVGDFARTLDARGLQQSGFGYTGIVIAALARNNPIAVPIVAVLLGGLANAGYSLQGPDFPNGLVGMLQGLILFFAIGGELLARYRIRWDGHVPARTNRREPALALEGAEHHE